MSDTRDTLERLMEQFDVAFSHCTIRYGDTSYLRDLWARLLAALRQAAPPAVCPHCEMPPVLPEPCTPEMNAVIETRIARDAALFEEGRQYALRQAGRQPGYSWNAILLAAYSQIAPGQREAFLAELTSSEAEGRPEPIPQQSLPADAAKVMRENAWSMYDGVAEGRQEPENSASPASIPEGYRVEADSDGEGEWHIVTFKDGHRVQIFTQHPLVIVAAEAH